MARVAKRDGVTESARPTSAPIDVLFRPPRPQDGAVAVALGLLLLVACVATYCGAALTWDGSSLLFSVLDGQHLKLPHDRYSLVLFQLPVLLASKLTDQVRVLELVYGAAYTIVPFAVAYGAWRLVREERPRLVVWPLLWTCLGALPGQMFFVTESLLTLQGGWLLLLIVGTRFSRRRLAGFNVRRDGSYRETLLKRS